MNLRHAAALALGIMTLSTVGCVTAQQQQQEAQQQAGQACLSLFADPGLDPIRDKVALHDPENLTTFAMRTNTQTVQQKEKQAIALWADKRQECFRMEDPTWEPWTPSQIVAVSHAAREATNTAIAELYLGRITYGEFATKQLAIYVDMATAEADLRQALYVHNQQLANQEAANWDAQMARLRAEQGVTCTSFANMTTCR